MSILRRRMLYAHANLTGGGAGSGPLSFTATDVATAWATSVSPPLTFSGMSIGTASSDRLVVAVIGVDGSAVSGVLSGVTIGGVSATKRSFVDTDANGFGLYIYDAPVPTGTTANVVVSCSGFPSGIGCVLGIITGSATTAFSAQNTSTYSAPLDPQTLTTTVPTNGIGIFAGNFDRDTTASWTNGTQYADLNHAGGAACDIIAGYTTNNSPSITGANGFGRVLASATWGP